MRKLVYGLIILLAVLHQDFWWWDTPHPLLGGVVPVGLWYHALVSVLAAVLWALAVKFCWPAGVDDDDPDAVLAATAEGDR